MRVRSYNRHEGKKREAGENRERKAAIKGGNCVRRLVEEVKDATGLSHVD